MIDKEMIDAISGISNDGLLAILWYSTMSILPELILVVGIIVGVRAFWKYHTEEDDK